MAVVCMPMEDILNLKSGDFDGERVRNVLPLVDFTSHRATPGYYDVLRTRMAETKTNLVPLWVSGEWLQDGHHRVVIASELGLTEMQVDNKDSGWQTWGKVI
jgi:hypothetical protein